MLEIKPITDKDEQNDICDKCGIFFNNELFAYKALDNGKLLACAQFDICGSNAVIYDMRQVTGTKDDNEAMFILGRAVLNFLDLCGVIAAEYRVSDDYDKRIAKMIGFKQTDNGKMEITLIGLFENPCQHGNSYADTKDNVN